MKQLTIPIESKDLGLVHVKGKEIPELKGPSSIYFPQRCSSRINEWNKWCLTPFICIYLTHLFARTKVYILPRPLISMNRFKEQKRRRRPLASAHLGGDHIAFDRWVDKRPREQAIQGY